MLLEHIERSSKTLSFGILLSINEQMHLNRLFWDTDLSKELMEICRDVDIVICEATYGRDKHHLCQRWGHMSPLLVNQLLMASSPRLMILNHFFDISAIDFIAQLNQEADRRTDLKVMGAYDGMEHST